MLPLYYSNTPAPSPPELEVQQVELSPATTSPVSPGSAVAVQAILEAKRGTELFSVPHAAVAFAIVSASGLGATVVPANGTTDDAGTIVVTVLLGDLPGETVVGATSGSASAQLPLESRYEAMTPPASNVGVVRRAGPGDTSGGPSGQSAAFVGLLAVVTAALIATLIVQSGVIPRVRDLGPFGSRRSAP